MLKVEDCADSTIRISTDADLNDKTLDKIKDLITFIYNEREKHFIVSEALTIANDEDEDLEEEEDDD